MTIGEGRRTIEDLRAIITPTEEEEFIYTEALQYLIKEAHDSDAMMELGGFYYEKKKFDLALRYYEMAAANGSDYADECLGYIWYYGRTGERDYERAFKHFSSAKKRGNLVAAYKVADMYKNGYYVEQDYEKYCEIIEELYPKTKSMSNVFAPVPEILTRLAHIRMKQDKNDEAINLFLKAKDYLAQRLIYNNFFGNLNIMKWLIDDLYTLVPFGIYRPLDLYDIHYLSQIPGKYTISIMDDTLPLEVEREKDRECSIKYNGKWFRNRDEFFKKAEYNGTALTELYFDITVNDDKGDVVID